MRGHEAVNTRYAKVRSLQYLQTWQMIVCDVSSFVSLSIKGLKENAKNLNY